VPTDQPPLLTSYLTLSLPTCIHPPTHLFTRHRDKPSRPFRCLDPQYRRELVRVYLTNVESICRRFCDDKRGKLAWLKEEEEGFAAWWRSLGRQQQRELVSDRGDTILKVRGDGV
jgi:hypothetical protein